MGQLTAGDTAPGLSLSNHRGESVDLIDALGDGGRVVVYFYPKAFTPGCTTQVCDFRDNLAALAGAGVRVLGVSGDDVETLAGFAAEHGVNFDLLSDPGSEAARAWGAWGERTINGETSLGPLRSTIIVNPDASVLAAEYAVSADGSVARVREQLGI